MTLILPKLNLQYKNFFQNIFTELLVLKIDY